MRRRIAIGLIATGTALALGVFFYRREEPMWTPWLGMIWVAAFALFVIGLALSYRPKDENRGFEVMTIHPSAKVPEAAPQDWQ